MKLDGKVALVTGSSRGIGRAIALRLAADGADVAVNYQVNRERAAEVAERITSLGRRSCTVQADVSDFDQVKRMHAEVVRSLGQVDILVNNAGILRDKSFVKMTPETWSEVMAVNLDSVFYCTKLVIEGMVERKYGRIVNLSSVIGRTGNFGQANYAAAKAGVIALTKTLAKEFARKGVTVNAVAPGFIDTDILSSVPRDVLDRLVAQIPIGRLGTPDEVAGAVSFLVSEDARYITGQVIDVNGGFFV